VPLHDTRELFSRYLRCCRHGHRFQCRAGCHHSGRRPFRLQVYRLGDNSPLIGSRVATRLEIGLLFAPHICCICKAVDPKTSRVCEPMF
jgi:hypothetical protein